MENVLKVLTAILGILAVIVCLATIGVVGYSLAGGNISPVSEKVENTAEPEEYDEEEAAPTPTIVPDVNSEIENQPVSIKDHVHDYKESIDRKATCYQAGRMKYTCQLCNDIYYVDIPSTEHVPDEWEIIREPSESRDGLREKRCIYCDEIVAQESIPYRYATTTSSSSNEPHVHEYMAETEREPSCILAGLRKYTCSCGSFYTEQISAPGHIATDWTVAEEATATKLGREQRTCTECGVLLDSRPIPVVQASPSPSSGNSSGSSGTSASPAATRTPQPTASPSASPAASSTATPTATPHSHEYTSYVLREANCKEKGIRSFVCSCGSTYAEAIPVDGTRHDYISAVFQPTYTSVGYTLYRCTRCNDTYMDNYTSMLK